jgi:hypothetical protein
LSAPKTASERVTVAAIFQLAGMELVTLHKSMTTSPTGWEQQIRRLPSAGWSSGSGA